MTAQTENEPVEDQEQWITVSDARKQAAAFVLAHLPEEPDEVDCETCRVIKAIAAGLLGEAPSGDDD